MKTLRVLAIAIAMALSTLVVAHENRAQQAPRIGCVVGAIHGGTLQSAGEGAVVGGIAGGIVGGIAGFFVGGVGAIPGAEIGVAVGGF